MPADVVENLLSLQKIGACTLRTDCSVSILIAFANAVVVISLIQCAMPLSCQASAASASTVGGGQIHQQAFGDHERRRRACGRVDGAPLRGVVQVRRDTLAAASGCLRRHQRILVIQHVREIDFDPPQVRRKFEPPRPRIETAAHAENRRDRFGCQRLQQQLIHKTAAHADPEAHHFGLRQPPEHRHTALARQPRREWIVHEAVRGLGFERPARGYHEGCVADVGDFAVR